MTRPKPYESLRGHRARSAPVNRGRGLAWCTGGHVKDIPPPVIWCYNGEQSEYRQVSIRCHRYNGIGVHYYVSVSVDDNARLDTRTDPPVWRRAWDDDQARGRTYYTKRYDDYSKAERRVRAAIRLYKRFGTAYVIEVDDSEVMGGTWFYREGD